MRDASGFILQKELQKLMELDMREAIYQSLSMEQINRLAQKINLLPLEYQHLLFFKYCFGSSIIEIDEILKPENTEGKLLYVENMLSRRIGLDNSWIDSKSMKDACELTLKEYMKEYDILEKTEAPNYSKAFRRRLKEIRTAQNLYESYGIIVKKVAVFILVSLLGLSTILAINVEARERFFHWIMEIFPDFSIIRIQDIEDSTLNDLTVFKINYIPKGFELVETNEGRNMLIYRYSTEGSQKLTIRLLLSEDEEQSYYDTENSEVEKFTFKGYQAYTWKTEELSYLVWHQDGIEGHISGNLEQDELIKIAEKIIKEITL
jgi:hypothetical protein